MCFVAIKMGWRPQCSIGLQPVFRESSLLCAQRAGCLYRLETYATLLLGLAGPDRASFKTLGEQYRG